MSFAPETVQLLQVLDAPVSWSLVILGWALLFLQERGTARRNEVREHLQHAIKLADEIERLALDYWTRPGSDPKCEELAREIKRQLLHLSSTKNCLHRVQAWTRLGKCQVFVLDIVLIQFRQAATGDNFDSPTRAPAPPHSMRLQEICAGFIAFKDKAEESYERQYR